MYSTNEFWTNATWNTSKTKCEYVYSNDIKVIIDYELLVLVCFDGAFKMAQIDVSRMQLDDFIAFPSQIANQLKAIRHEQHNSSSIR